MDTGISRRPPYTRSVLTRFARVVVASFIAADTKIAVSTAPDDNNEVRDGQGADQDTVKDEVDVPPEREDRLIGSR